MNLQEPFTVDGDGVFTTCSSSSCSRWWIPITFTSVAEGAFTNFHRLQPVFFLRPDDNQSSMPQLEEPFVVNLQQTGYYRVNYDQSNWAALANLLATNCTDIHVLNRYEVIYVPYTYVCFCLKSFLF